MTSTELWAEYVKKNPSFEGDKPITLSPAGLKKLFEQTWRFGEEHGFALGRAYGQTMGEAEMRRRSASSIFADIFKQ